VEHAIRTERGEEESAFICQQPRTRAIRRQATPIARVVVRARPHEPQLLDSWPVGQIGCNPLPGTRCRQPCDHQHDRQEERGNQIVPTRASSHPQESILPPNGTTTARVPPDEDGWMRSTAPCSR